MNTISILGSGWLGLPLAEHFISLGYKVNASIRSAERNAEIEAIGANSFIVDIDALTPEVTEFLQASILIVNIPSKNVAGFRKLVEAVKQSDVEKVIFVSSTSVYRFCNKTVTESDVEYYSDSPLLDIEALFDACSTIETTMVRFGGLIGYRRQPGRFFRSGKQVQNPDSPVNLIHRDDCVEILSRIVERQAWGEVFNCCADTHPTKREFYTHAAMAIDYPVPQFADSESASFKIISNDKVKQSLSYEFIHPDLMKIEFKPVS